MNFKIVSASDVIILREARRILKNLNKHMNKSEAHLRKMFDSPNYAKWAVADFEYKRMLDELEALHISVEENGDMSLDAQ